MSIIFLDSNEPSATLMLTALLQSWVPFLITACVFSLILWVGRYLLFTHNSKGSQQLFPRQAAMLVLILITLIALVLSLPIPESTQVQILSLIGLVLSALLAWSSTTVFSNLMAGAMMRFTKPFRTGDFIRADSCFGRVTERGLLDCEIQTISRELVSIPNSWLIARPVEVTRYSGTIVSSTLSLGYDVHHEVIRPLLKQAAAEAGLSEPYVHIMELGDFSVSYRVSGLLTEVKNLLTTRSNLNAHILDCLHHKGIEIMSPGYVNQRRLADDSKTIPERYYGRVKSDRTVAESIVFDKAEEAEQQELLQKTLLEQRDVLQDQLSETEKENRADIQAAIEAINDQLEELGKSREEKAEEKNGNGKPV